MELFQASHVVTAPADAIWGLFADFGHPERLAPAIDSCELIGEGVGVVRVVRVAGLAIRERLLELDAAKRVIRYEIQPEGDMPLPGLKAYVATISVRPISIEATRIDYYAAGEVEGAPQPVIVALEQLFTEMLVRIRLTTNAGGPEEITMTCSAPASVSLFGRSLSAADGMRLLADQFAEVSPMMSYLSARMADDDALLALFASLAPGQIPAQIFGVVNYLLADAPDDPLARHFPIYTPSPLPMSGLYPVFRAFCLRRRGEIEGLMASRTVQLTFPERAAPVLIALTRIEAAAGGPLGLIEVGCSAGLLLRFDRYRYDFGPLGALGDGAVTIPMELRGAGAKAPRRMPQIQERAGIELHPIDLASNSEVAWVLAALPPDRVDRRATTAAALALARENPLRIVRGDAVALLEETAETIGGTLCVLNSHCLYQWPAAARFDFERAVERVSRARDVHRISIEIEGKEPAEIRHALVRGGETVSTDTYGRADNFGAYVEIDSSEP